MRRLLLVEDLLASQEELCSVDLDFGGRRDCTGVQFLMILSCG
jgi:hypothetical protein